MLQHLLIFLIRPLLRHLLFLYVCYQIQTIYLLEVFNFGFLLICRLSICPLCPLLLFLDSLTMHGGKTPGISQCGILGQQMLCGNSEMLHIADLIFTILNLNFRKRKACDGVFAMMRDKFQGLKSALPWVQI